MPADSGPHPLAELVSAAAAGRFPTADGRWERMTPWRTGLAAIVAFTGHAVVVVPPDVSQARLAGLGIDGYGGAHHPQVVAELAGPAGWVDSLDVLLLGSGSGAGPPPPRLVSRPDLRDHPRARFASELRDDVRVLGRPDPDLDDVAIMSRGIAGLNELSVELGAGRRGRGAGAGLITAAVATVPAGALVVAAVAPGNAASLRAFITAGFRPIGSVQLFRPGAQPNTP
jgi:hypothetical protein